MTELRETVVPFRAGDGRLLNLVHVEGPTAPTKGPVVLVHGAGVRANVFRAPVRTTLVDALVAQGWDVWLENWRASIEFEPNEWTLDQAAVFDHPNAVRTVVEHTGADQVDAVVHCQGSTSFVMSAVAGLVPEVRTIVTNAVSLHPVIPRFSHVKLRGVAPLIARLLPFVDPRWGTSVEPPDRVAKAMVGFVRTTHHECDNLVCRMVSFTYGTGFPCLWEHDNLNDDTHEWLKDEFAKVPFTFFSQMARCVTRGHLVSVEGYKELPESLVARPPETDARFVLLAGEENRCFLADSQRRTYRWLDGLSPGRHALYTVPRYGHLDMFMGQHADRDVFPFILEELSR
ncbi:MAG: alpha/beta hydrolase [Actinomycetota bacterium]|nr:alpha/beta hydrolase [Actinomycetota bacterium]